MIYRTAAKFVNDGAGTLKSRVYGSKKLDLKTQKHAFALVSKALTYKKCLNTVIDNSQMLKVEKKLDRQVAILMVYDLLLGSKRLNCGKCYEKQAILNHKTRLHAELTKYKLRNPEIQEHTLNGPTLRWVRFNKESKLFERLKLHEVKSFDDVDKTSFYKDLYVPDLYAVSVEHKVSLWPEYKNGEVIIQDRASCFPVTILLNSNVINKEGLFIDACAAPGNKTSQLAKSVQRVIAFERDSKRAETLKKMITTAKLTNVDINVGDFTTSDPADYESEIEGLIVDPSCSGSGIFRETTVSNDRLTNLSEFQYLIMMHALKYDANCVVYSTCSIHKEENELVVKRLLEDRDVCDKWRLGTKDEVLPTWPRRGLVDISTDEIDMQGCVRVEQNTDGGIGFFAACFIRK